jgi:hypothetical protein
MSDIKCDLCDKTYKTDKTLQQHKVKIHANSAPTQTQPVQKQTVQTQPAKSAPAKSASGKQPAKSASGKQPAKSTSTKTATTQSTQSQQAGGRGTSAQQNQTQTQNDNGPTRHYIITGITRKNAEDMAAAGPPVRPPDTLESLRDDIDELRMLVYALVRTHYIQTLTEKSRMEQESSDSDGCGEKCGEAECTCE